MTAPVGVELCVPVGTHVILLMPTSFQWYFQAETLMGYHCKWHAAVWLPVAHSSAHCFSNKARIPGRASLNLCEFGRTRFNPTNRLQSTLCNHKDWSIHELSSAWQTEMRVFQELFLRCLGKPPLPSEPDCQCFLQHDLSHARETVNVLETG